MSLNQKHSRRSVSSVILSITALPSLCHQGMGQGVGGSSHLPLDHLTSLRGGMVRGSNEDNSEKRMEMQSLLIESKNDYSKTTSASGNSGAKVGVVMTLEEEYALELLELAKSTSLRGGMVGGSNEEDSDQRMEMQSLLTESKNDYSKTTSVSGNSGVKVGVAMTFEEQYALELELLESAESKNTPPNSPEDALNESSIFEPRSVSRGRLRG